MLRAMVPRFDTRVSLNVGRRGGGRRKTRPTALIFMSDGKIKDETNDRRYTSPIGWRLAHERGCDDVGIAKPGGRRMWDSQCANEKRGGERPFPRRGDFQFPQNRNRGTKDRDDVESGDDGGDGVKKVLIDAVALHGRRPEMRNRDALHQQNDQVGDSPDHAEGSKNPASLVQTMQRE